MRIFIKATNLSLSPSIKERVEEKIGSLNKFLTRVDPQIVEARVEVAKTKTNQRQGDVFRAEVNLKIGGRILRAEHIAGNLYSAIDLVKDELREQITKESKKEAGAFVRGARSWKKFWQIDPFARFRESKVGGMFKKKK